MEYDVPGYGTTHEERTENGKYGPESICKCPNPDCQSHEKNKLKFSVNKGERKGVFRCWSCGINGKVSNGEEIKQEPTKTRKVVERKVVSQYIQTLVKSLSYSGETKRYFTTRKKICPGLVKTFGIGQSLSIPDYPSNEIAEAVGLVNHKKNRYTNKFYGRIVFPIKRGEDYVFCVGRSVKKDDEIKFLNMPGDAPMFNEDILSSDVDKVFLCEGVPDSLALMTAGYSNVVGILGTQHFDQNVDKLKGKHIVLCMDNDKAGNDASKKMADMLKARKISYTRLQLEEECDVAEHLFKGGSIVEVDQSGTERPKELMYIRTEENLMLFGYGYPNDHDLVIGVRDINDRRGEIKANLDFAFRGGFKYSGKCDLSNVRARSSFAKHLSDTNSGVDKKKISLLLNDIHTGVRQLIQEKEEEKPKSKEYVMSEEEKEEAIKLLSSSKLLFKIKNALRRQQIVGEEVNKILTYLIFTSRIMPRPISAIIKGLSSSGKTHLMKMTMTLIPPEGVFVLQEATAKAFFYLEEDSLMHKMIVIGEMHGGEQSQYSIREAQDGVTSGDLIIATVQKDPDSQEIGTVTKRVKGPCGFITSTTNPEINPENETRNFSIFVQVSPEKVEQTAVVQEEQYLGTANDLSEDEILQFHNIQRCLEKGLKVRIPYVRTILDAFPVSPVRVMRDRIRFLTILEVIAILHQYQDGREIIEEKGQRYIVANMSDYYIAKILLDEILVETLYELPPKAKDIYYEIINAKERWLEEQKDNQSLWDDIPAGNESTFKITYKEIAELCNMRKKEAVKWSKPLRDKGYLVYASVGRGRGQESELTPVEKDFYQGFLPTPEDIAVEFPHYYGEVLYNPVTGDERTIERPASEIPDDLLDAMEDDLDAETLQ